MIKDIEFPKIENVFIAIVKEDEENWAVYIINKMDKPILNVLISSKGYGKIEKESRKSSALRHFFEEINENSYKLVELIRPELFQLTNEFWLSFSSNNKMYDKKYIFLPDTIKEENYVNIPVIDKKGILHP